MNQIPLVHDVAAHALILANPVETHLVYRLVALGDEPVVRLIDMGGVSFLLEGEDLVLVPVPWSLQVGKMGAVPVKDSITHHCGLSLITSMLR